VGSVIQYPVGAAFRISIFKSLTASPNTRWVNTYDVVALSAGGSSDLNTACDKLLQYEQRFHLTAVRFDKYIVSTRTVETPLQKGEEFSRVDLYR
jgi:hypothetical protein